MTAPLTVDLSKIPSFPPTATRVLALLSKPEPQIPELVVLIQKDPVFGAEILRVANSAAFSENAAITSLSHCIARVGLVRLRSLTMTVAMRSVMNSAFKRPIVRRCWAHSLASGLLAKRFSGPAGVEANEAYTLGLLHDLGRLGLLTVFPDEYSNLLGHSYNTQQQCLAAEEFLFGADHCSAGKALAKQWNLSESLQEVAASHHDVPTERTSTSSRLIYVVCAVAECLGFGCNSEEKVAPSGPRLRRLSENAGFSAGPAEPDPVEQGRHRAEVVLGSASAEVARAVSRDLPDLKQRLIIEMASLQFS